MASAYTQGLQTIDKELEAVFNQAGVHNISIVHVTRGTEPADTSFKVMADGKSEELIFTVQEIEDSARAIDSIAASNVRVLVSRFTG
jgi:L-rhamnose mutarotase